MPAAADRPLRATVRRAVRWRVVLLGVCAIGVVLAATLGLAVTHRPSWYHPPAVNRARLHADKAALAELQEEISAALNAGQAVHFELSEDQLNRWIAARTEMWPEAAFDVEGLEQPQINVLDGRIRVGATVRQGAFSGVLSLIGRSEVTDTSLVVYYEAARLGAIPIPRGWIIEQLAALPPSGRGAVDVDGRGTIALKNEWVWPNGKRRFRLRELRAMSGMVSVTLEPISGERR